MAYKAHREIQAAAWRELAKRARRLAANILDDPARDSLLKYSEELDEKAAKLAASPEPRDGRDES